MADHFLTEEFETNGEWFLPDRPDQLVSGYLSYNSGRAELQLNEAFHPLTGRLTAVDEHSYPLIYGTTIKGEAVTLVNAMRFGVSFNFSSGGLRQPEKVISNLTVLGAHVPPNWMPPKLSFRIPGLQIWLSRPTVHQTIEDTPQGRELCYRVKSVPSEAARVDSISTEISWWIGTTSSADPFGSVSVSSSGWVGICPDAPQQLDWYFNNISKLTTLFSFLAGCPMQPDFISASLGDPHHNASVLVGFQGQTNCTYTHILEFFLPRDRMEVGLDDVIRRWFDAGEQVWTAAQLAASVLGSESLWLHVEFLSLMQALEGFHRGLSDGTYMEESEYVTVKDALIAAIPAIVGTDHKSSLTSRIRYGNQISLAKRLNELASRLSDDIRVLLFGGAGKCPRSWVDTRNYYTHWDKELLANVLEGKWLYYTNVRLRHFVRALYLDLIGIPQEAILGALKGPSSNSQFLLQILDRERVASDPTYEPAAYGTISVIPKSKQEECGLSDGE